MRVTAKDDREEIGNTMDLNEEQMHQVVKFKTGHAYVYHEGEDQVRMLRMLNFKGEHDIEEPPTDEELKVMMQDYEKSHRDLYLPYEECKGICQYCDRKVRNRAEAFVINVLASKNTDIYERKFGAQYKDKIDGFRKTLPYCQIALLATQQEKERIEERYGPLGNKFGECVYMHMMNISKKQVENCKNNCKANKKCKCDKVDRDQRMDKFKNI